MHDDILSNAIQEISRNHDKIIDDWCKAYMAQIYQETGSIRPGDFVLNQQYTAFGSKEAGFKYWFTRKDDK